MSTHPERVATFRDQLAPGTRLECVRNDRIPSRAGLRCTVADKSGVWSFPVTVENDPTGKMEPGSPYWMSLPKRAGDLIEATPERIAYQLDQGETVEWKVRR